MSAMIRSWFLCSLFFLGYVQECWQLVIKSVNVPATVKAGDTDYVILDCDYDLENTRHDGLVVKWFFNTNDLVYQWILGMSPMAGELTNNYVDLTYEASNNSYTKHRAMKLNKPGIDLTGDYTCVISTFEDEKSASASMVVYSTEEKFDLVYRKKTIDDKDGVVITCIAEGLFPEPTLDISIEGLPEKQAAKPNVTVRKDGLYDILSRTALLDEDLPEAAIVKCLLGIPKANYNVSHKTVYYPGPPTTTSTATTKLLHIMENQALDNSEPGDGGGSFAGRASTSILLVMLNLAFVNLLN
ncbi:uncharacterized protein LOC116433344 isoform X1 [Nomia melanderi]|uniref:uncharacterized protein LOC116433344 isoform X1 n=1 Tax=Nomia melanderi TaxID=2448451 RepID=UPI003FCCD66B